tara:strand:+ start:2733 stop:2834 length:102 start_codon:yes stop_codon:yes gene_type:complete
MLLDKGVNMKEQWTDWVWAVVIIGLWFIGLTYA